MKNFYTSTYGHRETILDLATGWQTGDELFASSSGLYQALNTREKYESDSVFFRVCLNHVSKAYAHKRTVTSFHSLPTFGGKATKGINHFVITALAAAIASGGALAAENSDQDDMRKWAKARENAIPAEEILAGSVKNFANHVGEVSKLILSEDHSQIEYVLFEVPYPYSFYASEDGFVNFDAVEIEDDFYGVNVMVEDASVNLPRDQLTLTKAQVDDRSIDNLIGDTVTFSDNKTREIQDILISPKTGEVTHYVVEMNPDAIFSENRRAIPASHVSVHEDGDVAVDMGSKVAEGSSAIDPRYL